MALWKWRESGIIHGNNVKNEKKKRMVSLWFEFL